MIWEINGYGYNKNGMSNSREPSERFKSIEDELAEIVTSNPGEYTIEDLERYIIEKEYLGEQRERARQDATQVQARLVAEKEKEARQDLDNAKLYQNPEENKDDVEISQMMDEVEEVSSIQDQDTTGSVK